MTGKQLWKAFNYRDLKRKLYEVKRYGDYKSRNMRGEPELSLISQYFFKSKCTLISKLPGLINVIKGEIKLVGNSTLSGEEVKLLSEECREYVLTDQQDLYTCGKQRIKPIYHGKKN